MKNIVLSICLIQKNNYKIWILKILIYEFIKIKKNYFQIVFFCNFVKKIINY